MSRVAGALPWAATRSFCDELLGFRIDLEPAGAGGPGFTVASDYEPTPLSALAVELEGADPEAALHSLLPDLHRAARRVRPPQMRAEPVAGEPSLTLYAAIVKAPVVARERTSAAEIAAQRSPWREVARFGWRGAACEVRPLAYDLLGALELRAATGRRSDWRGAASGAPIGR
jgi:hypothetical protein